MIKKLLSSAVLALSVGMSSAYATDMSGLEAGAMAYLSPSTPVMVGFYGETGQKLLTGVNITSDTAAVCSLFNSNGTALYEQSSSELYAYTLTSSGLFVFTCVHASGASDLVIPFAIDESAFYRARGDAGGSVPTDYDSIINQLVGDVINNINSNGDRPGVSPTPASGPTSEFTDRLLAAFQLLSARLK